MSYHLGVVGAIEPYGDLPLFPGEEVLWAAMAAKRRPPVSSGLLVALGMAVLGLFFTGPELARRFSPFLLVFLIVWEFACLNVPVAWLRAWRAGRRLRYAVTDRRILLSWDGRGSQSLSYEYRLLGPPQVVDGGVRMELLNGQGKAVELGGITDPLVVRDLITQAQAQAKPEE